MKERHLIVILWIVIGLMTGALVAHLFFSPKTWSDAKSIICLCGAAGGMIALFLVGNDNNKSS